MQEARLADPQVNSAIYQQAVAEKVEPACLSGASMLQFSCEVARVETSTSSIKLVFLNRCQAAIAEALLVDDWGTKCPSA